MSRTIAVLNSDGEHDYVVAEEEQVPFRPLAGGGSEFKGKVSFYLSSGQPVNLESAERFEDLDGVESYYAQDPDDIDWLNTL